MKKIAVVGANGHVGTELCLLLTRYPQVEVVPICRTAIASALLRRCGLECRHGSVSEPGAAAELLAGCDLVVDASLPKGPASELRQVTAAIQRGIAEGAPNAAGIVYLSSIMAIGMAPHDRFFRRCLTAGTVYGATKRLGEQAVRHFAKSCGRSWWVLRLGQVHGVLQAASRSLRNGVSGAVIVPRGLSWTVFAVTVAEAVRNILLGLEKSGEYVVVSSPPWTWREVLEFYDSGSRDTGMQFIVEEAHEEGLGPIGALSEAAVRLMAGVAIERKEWIVAHGLALWPDLERRVHARWSVRRARLAVDSLGAKRRREPFGRVFGGEPAGARMRTLSDSRGTARDAWEWVEERFCSCMGEIPEGHSP